MLFGLAVSLLLTVEMTLPFTIEADLLLSFVYPSVCLHESILVGYSVYPSVYLHESVLVGYCVEARVFT